MKTILFMVVILACYVSCVDFSCTNNKDCMITGNLVPDSAAPSYCNLTENICFSKTGKAWAEDGKPLGSNEYCSDAFKRGGKCVKYAFDGCEVKPSVVCINAYSEDGKTCVAPKSSDHTDVYNGEGELCGVTKDKTTYMCKKDFACHKNRCIARLPYGAMCEPTTGIECAVGYLCHSVYKKCYALFSGADGSACTNDYECDSGYCNNQICKPLSRTACYSNADCVSGNLFKQSYCKREKLNENAPGVCINPYKTAYQEYIKCSQALTQEEFEQKSEKCLKEQIKAYCAENCFQPKEDRHPLGFVFDCKELTKKTFSGSDCAITSFLENCDAVLDYSAASTVSASIALFISVIAFILF